MAIHVRPARVFEDVAAVIGPLNPAANVCWCLSYRIPSRESLAMTGPERGERMRELRRQDPAPGVLAYDGDDVVGWAAVHRRADTGFARNKRIPHVDDLDAWCVWCFRVRPGHRRTGIMHHLLDGAIDFARAQGAPMLEGYPADNAGARVNQTSAYVGTRALFERAGFTHAADTGSVVNGFPRIIMRLDLR